MKSFVGFMVFCLFLISCDGPIFYSRDNPDNICNAAEGTVKHLVELDGSKYIDNKILEFRIICSDGFSKVRVEWRMVELEFIGLDGWIVHSEYGWRREVSTNYWDRKSLGFDNKEEAEKFIMKAKIRQKSQREYICN